MTLRARGTSTSLGASSENTADSLQRPLLPQPPQRELSWWEWLGLGTRDKKEAPPTREKVERMLADCAIMQESMAYFEAALVRRPKGVSDAQMERAARMLVRCKGGMRKSVPYLKRHGVDVPGGEKYLPAESGKSKAE
jgi:hypothetical protein